MARRAVPAFAFEYVEGGAEDELALARNRLAFDALNFVPRTLVDTSARHTRSTLFGRELAMPCVIAPTGLNGMLRHGADLALARAAAKAGIPFTQSTVSNLRPAEVAAAGGRLWMQLYQFRERAITADILGRAEAAGYEALVFTTDANVFGAREWDRRSFRSPGRLTLRRALDVARHPRWIFDVLVPHGVPSFVNVADFLDPEDRTTAKGVARIPELFAPAVDWQDVARLRDQWRGRLLIKGILDPADVERAIGYGCDGVVLTNHGGRQLDACVAPIEMLPEIARSFGQRTTIIIDSGFRRGSEIAKALALGALAVMLGRATLYGLAAGGEAGAAHALALLKDELHRTLGLVGVNSIAELTPSLLRAGPPTRRGAD